MTLQNPLQDNLNPPIITSQLADQGAAFAVITLGVAMVLFTLGSRNHAAAQLFKHLLF